MPAASQRSAEDPPMTQPTSRKPKRLGSWKVWLQLQKLKLARYDGKARGEWSVRLNLTQHGKSHQAQTPEGQIASSFLVRWVVVYDCLQLKRFVWLIPQQITPVQTRGNSQLLPSQVQKRIDRYQKPLPIYGAEYSTFYRSVIKIGNKTPRKSKYLACIVPLTGLETSHMSFMELFSAEATFPANLIIKFLALFYSYANSNRRCSIKKRYPIVSQAIQSTNQVKPSNSLQTHTKYLGA